MIEVQGNADLLKAQNRSLQDSVKEVERKHQVNICVYIYIYVCMNELVFYDTSVLHVSHDTLCCSY